MNDALSEEPRSNEWECFVVCENPEWQLVSSFAPGRVAKGTTAPSGGISSRETWRKPFPRGSKNPHFWGVSSGASRKTPLKGVLCQRPEIPPNYKVLKSALFCGFSPPDPPLLGGSPWQNSAPCCALLCTHVRTTYATPRTLRARIQGDRPAGQ